MKSDKLTLSTFISLKLLFDDFCLSTVTVYSFLVPSSAVTVKVISFILSVGVIVNSVPFTGETVLSLFISDVKENFVVSLGTLILHLSFSIKQYLDESLPIVNVTLLSVVSLDFVLVTFIVYVFSSPFSAVTLNVYILSFFVDKFIDGLFSILASSLIVTSTSLGVNVVLLFGSVTLYVPSSFNIGVTPDTFILFTKLSLFFSLSIFNLYVFLVVPLCAVTSITI